MKTIKTGIALLIMMFLMTAWVSGQTPHLDSLKAYILTPPSPSSPRLTGSAIFGARPGSQFIYFITATGLRPLKYSVTGLPEGLILDKTTGRITGKVLQKGTYPVKVTVSNAKGTAKRNLTIVVGDKIALTPPMGWNSWNCWGGAVSQEKVLSSARAMAEKGLRDHGWTYINIDDGWQSIRGGKYNGIQPNSKFPDMKALADEIHGLGLKFGIYSGPWIGTYEGHIGCYSNNSDGTYDWIKAGNHNQFYRYGTSDSIWKKRKTVLFKHGLYSFVENDVKQWADWGIDYLKYDWNPNDVPHVEEMQKALRARDRDIVYSLSNSAPFAEAAEWARLANSWRTTGDIRDNWKSLSKIGFNQGKWTSFGGPGHWNDPDMLVVGQVGWGPKLHSSNLKPAEQYTHISLWCLLSAPLLIGCDIAQLDDFTLNLLTNDEVLAVDQDPLGKQAVEVSKQGDCSVYAKDLANGTKAVGLFNQGEPNNQEVILKWSDLGITGKYVVRDLWRQKDLGTFTGEFKTKVEPHGVVMVSLRKTGTK